MSGGTEKLNAKRLLYPCATCVGFMSVMKKPSLETRVTMSFSGASALTEIASFGHGVRDPARPRTSEILGQLVRDVLRDARRVAAAVLRVVVGVVAARVRRVVDEAVAVVVHAVGALGRVERLPRRPERHREVAEILHPEPGRAVHRDHLGEAVRHAVLDEDVAPVRPRPRDGGDGARIDAEAHVAVERRRLAVVVDRLDVERPLVGAVGPVRGQGAVRRRRGLAVDLAHRHDEGAERVRRLGAARAARRGGREREDGEGRRSSEAESALHWPTIRTRLSE